MKILLVFWKLLDKICNYPHPSPLPREGTVTINKQYLHDKMKMDTNKNFKTYIL